MAAFKKSWSSIVPDYSSTFWQRRGASIIKRGPMPRHVAIIMDGNRRYAKEKGLPTVSDGHIKGEETLRKVMKMYLDLEIKEMTVFGFSDQNLKRSPSEVKAIMNLTLDSIRSILSEEGSYEMEKHGIRWDVRGNWDKIPVSELKSLFAQTCILTKGHKKLKMHLAFGYSSREEIYQALREIADGLREGKLEENDLDEDLFNEVLNRDRTTYPVDILIRTGGDHRFSDFMMWQSSKAYLHFTDVTWPEFSFGDLLWAIFYYQHQVIFEGLPRHEVVEQEHKKYKNGQRKSGTVFVENIRKDKWDSIMSQIK